MCRASFDVEKARMKFDLRKGLGKWIKIIGQHDALISAPKCVIWTHNGGGSLGTWQLSTGEWKVSATNRHRKENERNTDDSDMKDGS